QAGNFPLAANRRPAFHSLYKEDAMKLLRSSPHSRPFCLPLACLLALSACAPGTVGADAEPAPIEVPPPVEQTNEGLTIFYTDYDESTAKILDAAVTQYNTLHPDQP